MKLFILVAVSFFSGVIQVSTEFDTSAYYRMPDVYKFDDFDNCLGFYGGEATYCVASSFIKPDHNSELYKAIESFSSKTKQHLRHDKLQRGICLNSCKDLLRKLGNGTQKFFVDKFTMDSKLIFDFIKYPNAELDRLAYNEIINKCVNIELMGTHNLSAFSTVEYCKQSGVQESFDSLEILTSCILVLIVSVTILSSFYDRHLKNLKKIKDGHYKSSLGLKYQRALTAFSVKRNWHILTAPVKENVRELRFIEAIRTFIILGVIYNHCVMMMMQVPSLNPKHFEDVFGHVSSTFYILGIPIIQTFLVIGGFLTAYLFMTRMDKEMSSNAALFFRGIVGRYLRFAPLLALAILLHSTCLYRLGDGPFWDRINFTEKQLCRENWWTNLLFLDNYINVEHKCLIHSWYLGVDFWCRILATLCLIQIYRKPSWKVPILTAVIGLSALALAITVYVYKLEAVAIFPPENIRNQLFQTSESTPMYFELLFAPTHLNLANYFFGVATGLFYHRHKTSGKTFVAENWHLAVGYSCLVIYLLSTASSFIFYGYEFEKPSILNSLLSIAMKFVWGLVTPVFLLAVSQRLGWIFRTTFNHGVFRITGRISYATYIIHMFVIRLILPSVHQPLYLSGMNILVYGLAACSISSFFGLLLTLCIDLPVATICSMLNLKKGL